MSVWCCTAASTQFAKCFWSEFALRSDRSKEAVEPFQRLNIPGELRGTGRSPLKHSHWPSSLSSSPHTHIQAALNPPDSQAFQAFASFQTSLRDVAYLRLIKREMATWGNNSNIPDLASWPLLLVTLEPLSQPPSPHCHPATRERCEAKVMLLINNLNRILPIVVMIGTLLKWKSVNRWNHGLSNDSCRHLRGHHLQLMTGGKYTEIAVIIII